MHTAFEHPLAFSLSVFSSDRKLLKGPAESGHVKKCQTSPKSVKTNFNIFSTFFAQGKNRERVNREVQTVN